jgi:uncharacterized membrane protein YphA (DoxX/SURF4 family)
VSPDTSRPAARGRPSARRPAVPAAQRPATAHNWMDQAGRLAGAWAPTLGRVLLGLVLAWFGYHELVTPALWTGYVPVVPATSSFAVLLVLGHGWLLLILAVAMIAGIAPRAVAAAAAVLLLEIVISLTVTGGLSDLTLRDVGVLGLAVILTGRHTHRLVLSR